MQLSKIINLHLCWLLINLCQKCSYIVNFYRLYDILTCINIGSSLTLPLLVVNCQTLQPSKIFDLNHFWPFFCFAIVDHKLLTFNILYESLTCITVIPELSFFVNLRNLLHSPMLILNWSLLQMPKIFHFLDCWLWISNFCKPLKSSNCFIISQKSAIFAVLQQFWLASLLIENK